MLRVLLVGIGGFSGAVLRYAVSGWVHRLAPATGFPYGTAVVNVSGCLVLGLLAGLFEARGAPSPDARAFLFIGLLGGFTTFSTFGYETFYLLRDSQAVPALANVTLHVVASVGALWLGYVAAKLI